MPARAKAPCSYPGCATLVVGSGKCERHAKQVRKDADARRPSATQRGYDHRWRKARERYLRLNPLCVSCFAVSRTAAATVVDHVIDHKGDERLFWDEGNWQALCKGCHDRKTVATFGFGRLS